MRSGAVDPALVHRAGLLHDLGRVAVPTGIWETAGALRAEEWELVRLHPYHSGRILARVAGAGAARSDREPAPRAGRWAGGGRSAARPRDRAWRGLALGRAIRPHLARFRLRVGQLSDDKAARTLRGFAGADPQAPITLRQGRRPQPWLRNCVALGDAATMVEPLEWTNLHLAHSAIDRLVAMMPDRDCAPVEMWDYNRQCAAETDRVRDFLALHYAASRRDEPFWRRMRDTAPPESLAPIRCAVRRARPTAFLRGRDLHPRQLACGSVVLTRTYTSLLWLWRAPTLFQETLDNEWIHSAQHLSFFLSALLFWWSLIQARSTSAYGSGVVYLFTTAIHTSALGALLTFAPTLWYPEYAETVAAWGFTPLEDQQVGGLIMWVPGGLIFMMAGLWLFAEWLRHSDSVAARRQYAD